MFIIYLLSIFSNLLLCMLNMLHYLIRILGRIHNIKANKKFWEYIYFHLNYIPQHSLCISQVYLLYITNMEDHKLLHISSHQFMNYLRLANNYQNMQYMIFMSTFYNYQDMRYSLLDTYRIRLHKIYNLKAHQVRIIYSLPRKECK